MSLPVDERFWMDLMEDGKKWGLHMYEQDWLYIEFVGVNNTLLKSASLGREWMLQMGRATNAHALGLQLCMAWPRHVLQSLEMPAVTQALECQGCASPSTISGMSAQCHRIDRKG